jgi:hypothetical protein
MNIKDLFKNKTASFENASTGSNSVESKNLVITTAKRDQQFIPNIDFSLASNFAKFGSAELYYETSIKRVYNDYPYDGSRNEKLIFELSSSYLDRWIFNNKYPKSTGYVNFSYPSWGSLNGSITSDGYGIPNSIEFIYARGGLHTASAGMESKPLWKTFSDSVKYDSAKDRTTTFVLNLDKGFTVEFWLKKDAFDITKTKKEVIFDLWNGELSSSSDYGRFTLELSGTGPAQSGQDTFRLSLQSGTNGFFNEAIGSTTVTTSSLGNWAHYAFSFVSGASGVTSRLYVDGDLNEQKNLGSVGIGSIGGLFNGYIGALQTSPSSSNGTHTQTQLQYAGKLSASLDEFRFWKVKRTAEQIYNNWHRDVGGGTNTDDANTNLGLYYKFNEGIVGDSSFDSVVLDYSGRIANGTWNGYVAGARNTGSAFQSSSHAIAEVEDPIIRSTHPDVVSTLAELKLSGSTWDSQNTTNLFFKTVPEWMKEEDTDLGEDNLKKIYQIMSSYFDTLYAQTTSLTSLKDTVYPLNQGKAIPFAKRLLQNKGFVANDILLNTNLLEKIEGVDDQKTHFEKDISEIKNLIYTNLHNNLDTILKSKGNEKSIRNTLRCFGIDDELVKLNVYTDNGIHYFSDKYRQTSLMKKYVSFHDEDRFNSTIYQTSSVNNSLTYITGSDASQKEINSAFTVEVSVLMPKSLNVFEEGSFKIPFTKSSIYGMHEASATTGDYTWEPTDIANFQVFAQRDRENSSRAKFVLETYDGRTILTSSFFAEVYSNQTWNLAVRVKPEKYPFQGNVVETTSPTYKIEFYGVNHAFGTVQSEFSLSASLNNASGSAFLTKSKRFYVGAHRTNFTGSVLNQSDIKIGGFRYYLDHLSDSTIRQHNLDPVNFGLDESYRSLTMFNVDMGDKQIPSTDLLAINWDFETVSTSDGSGEFIVDDLSSGSVSTRYGWIDNVSKVENRASGFGFPVSSTTVARNEIVYANKKQLPEISFNSDKVIIEDEEVRHFIRDEDKSDKFYSLEKSMSQVISDEMLKMISSIVEFNNLIGKAVDRYRDNYKNLDLLRRLFYEKVEEDPDFDKFTRYYKWIDSSISYMTSQLFPISARHSGQIYDMVESHIFERSKYKNKFPTIKTFTATESQIKGSSEIRYNWKFGHAPIDGDENKNQVWQRLRKERTDITEREEIRKVVVTENTGSAVNLAKSDLTVYKGSTFALRRLSRPYRVSQELEPPLHGGINYPPKKNRDIILHLAQRHGAKGTYGQPLNVVVAGPGTGSGIIPQQFTDTLDPNLKKRVHLDVFAGRYSDNQIIPGPADIANTYNHRVTELDLPVTIISQSVNSGYNAHVVDRFDSGSIVTNIHSDTVSPTNHIPMQGPFAETWVGGHQHRHIAVNRYDASLIDDDTGAAPLNNIDNKYTRPEAWMLKLGDKEQPHDGALGIVGPDYGGPYPDPARKVAVFYREERAKRPFNIKNIRYTTGSRNLGNFKENYEIISAGGKLQNNLYLRKNPDQSNYLPTTIGSILPETTHPMSLFGQAPFVSGNVFGIAENNRQPDGDLIIIAPIVGAAASGSFKLLGFEHAQSGHILQVTSSATDLRKFTVGNSSDTSSERFFTGSSDTEFFNNFTASFKGAATTDSSTLDSRYSISYTTSSAVYSMGMQSEETHGAGKVLQSEDATTAVNPTVFTFYANVLVNSASVVGGHTIFMLTSSNSLSSNPTDATHHLQIKNNNDLEFDLKFTGSGGQAISRKFTHANFGSTYLNKWTNIIFTYNSGSDPIHSLTLRINGVSSSLTPSSATMPTNAEYGIPAPEAIFVFNRSSVTATDFRGAISQLIFYNFELDESQVDQLYNCGIAPTGISDSHLPGSVRLSHFYTFGDHASDDPTNGGKIIDLSANANHLDVIDTHGSGFFSFVTSSVPLTASQAEFFITASQNGSAFNIDFNSSKCSFNIVNDVAGGIDDDPGDVRRAHDVVIPVITSSVTNTVISSRFSAPGGIDTSPAYLDVYSREYSVYNALPFRNLSVRGSGSGESGTIRIDSQASRREGLRTLLSRHSGKFGIDSQFGSVRSEDYVSEASFNKTHRNVGRRPTDTSTIPVPVFNEDHNNAHMSSLLPRSDFQYSWVTSSLGSNYSYKSGLQRIYGYADADGMLSSSVDIGGESGHVAAINFPTASEIFGV